MILQLCDLPPPLPPPVSNSSCLFTRYQPLYPSCYTILLYFSKYYTVRPWCWERLRAGGEGGAREWDGWMASLIQWTWVWASSRRRWSMGQPGVLQSMGSWRVGHDSDWTTNTGRLKTLHFCVLVCFFMYYLCEKYYELIIVQYYIANCVSWVPRLALLDLWTN